jgi:hypothetical protein
MHIGVLLERSSIFHWRPVRYQGFTGKWYLLCFHKNTKARQGQIFFSGLGFFLEPQARRACLSRLGVAGMGLSVEGHFFDVAVALANCQKTGKNIASTLGWEMVRQTPCSRKFPQRSALPW